MSDRIERPLFYEGQTLGADELTAAVEHARGQQARHNRYLHLWGIAQGLKLTGKEKRTDIGATYQEVTLGAGLAVDGTGREIVVPEDERLSEALFESFNVVTPEPNQPNYYPVFLKGQDEAAAQPTFSAGACGNTQPVRQVEGYAIEFGRPGDELSLDEQDQPEIVDGPLGGWRILLGFVQWKKELGRFSGVSDEANGVGRRYAGVQADAVAARGERLTLRTRTQSQEGKPAVMLDEQDGGRLLFGQLTGQGTLTEVFSVNAKGDVTAKGKLQGAVAPGSVQLQSGIATDGVTLPLPPGITEEQVAQGQATLHIVVTPLLPGALAADSLDVPFECKVEAATRRVLCRFRRVNYVTNLSTDLPGACNYLVLASVPASTGG